MTLSTQLGYGYIDYLETHLKLASSENKKKAKDMLQQKERKHATI